MLIKLIDYMPVKNEGNGWGTPQGREVHQAVNSVVEDNPKGTVFNISLEGVKHTDVSFARESIILLAHRYRGIYTFCLSNFFDPDLVENWDLAAKKMGQPFTVWQGNKPLIIGPEPSEGTKEILDFVLAHSLVVTSEVAAKFDLKISNASNKLKKLVQEGYILQRKRPASSGGVEYEYFRIE